MSRQQIGSCRSCASGGTTTLRRTGASWLPSLKLHTRPRRYMTSCARKRHQSHPASLRIQTCASCCTQKPLRHVPRWLPQQSRPAPPGTAASGPVGMRTTAVGTAAANEGSTPTLVVLYDWENAHNAFAPLQLHVSTSARGWRMNVFVPRDSILETSAHVHVVKASTETREGRTRCCASTRACSTRSYRRRLHS